MRSRGYEQQESRLILRTLTNETMCNDRITGNWFSEPHMRVGTYQTYYLQISRQTR